MMAHLPEYYYYFNMETGEANWSPPAAVLEQQQQAAAAALDLHDDSGKDDSTANATTPTDGVILHVLQLQPIAIPVVKCPPDFKMLSFVCVKVINNGNKSWRDAKRECRGMKARFII